MTESNTEKRCLLKFLILMWRLKYGANIQEYTSGTWTPRLKIIWHDTTKNIIFIDDSCSQNKIWKGTLRQEIHDTSSAGC